MSAWSWFTPGRNARYETGSLYVYRSREGLPYLQAAAGDNARGHKIRRVEGAAAAAPICYHTGMELILFTGLQAAGKSTFYRERFAGTHTLVSKDVLRNNPRPERRQEQLIAEALAAGRSVVVDNTNPTPEVRAPLIALGRRYGATIVGYSFVSTAGESLARNRQRQGKARVPDVAIFATRKRLVPPSYAEGFDQLYAVRIAEGGRFAVAPWT